MVFKENELLYRDYTRLRADVGWKNYSKEQTAAALNHSLYSITVEEGPQVIAMGRLVGDGLYYMIVDIVVSPQYQRRKIGTAIIKKLLEYTEKQTPADGRTSVQLIAEKDSELFYEKLGFKKIPHEFCGSGMRKVIHGSRCL